MKSTKKVLLLNPYYSGNNITAANKCFEKLFENLHHFTSQCTLISSCEVVPNWLKVENIRVLNLKFSGSVWHRVFTYVKIALHFCFNRYDIVFSEFNPLPFSALFSKQVWLRLLHVENQQSSRRGFLSELLFRAYLKMFSSVSRISNNYKILTISQQSQQDIVNFGLAPADIVQVSYIGVDSEVMKSYVNSSTELISYQYEFIYVGNFSRRKNVELIPKALSMIQQPLKVLMIGRDLGTKKSVETLCSELCGWHTISFSENLTEEDLLHSYSNSAIFMTASLHEGFGMPVVESACLGIPVICSDLAVFREIASHSTFYDVSSAEELSTKMLFVLDNFRKFKIDSLNYAEFYLEKFDWDSNTQSFLKCLF